MTQKLNGLLFSPLALCLATIFHKTSELILPVYFSPPKGVLISNFNLLNYNYFQALVAAPLGTPIMLPQPPYLVFNFLFMSRVSSGEGLD